MSPENELNENELWELLKEPIESEPPSEPKKPRKKDQPAEESEPKTKTVITEKRKKALVWYLVGLFGIAFLVVLLSLFLRGEPGGNSSTTPDEDPGQLQELYDRINQLEEENQLLKEENTELEAENQELTADYMEQQEMMDNLKLLNDELSQSLEYVEGSALYSDENSQLLARTMKAYELLTRAQNAFIDYNEEVLEQTMTELEEYLDLLSNEALNAYYMVIEYMEQPYLGQE